MTKDSRNLIWIMGEGGLLGSSLSSQSQFHSTLFCLWDCAKKFDWKNPLPLRIQFKEAIQKFQAEVGRYSSWTLLWAAGSGVIGSSDNGLKLETDNFIFFLETLKEQFQGNFIDGHFFLASSAGGVWAGSQTLPISESAIACPVSEYGRQKLKQEEALIRLATAHSELKVMIGRISNLYGNRQNMSKPQGLLSQLCRSTLLRVPLNIFVPQETIRDYIFTDDCAELIFRSLQTLWQSKSDSNILLKIFASGEPASIRTILACLHRLTKREPMIICPPQAVSHQHPLELSFKTQVLVESYTCRPLIEGLKLVLDYQESLLQLGQLPYPEAS